MRVVLRGPFDKFSGIGSDAIALAVNLEKAGVDVLPMPTMILPGLPREFTQLLEKDPRGQRDIELSFGVAGRSGPAPKHVLYLTDPTVSAGLRDEYDHVFVTSPSAKKAVEQSECTARTSVLSLGIEEDQWPVLDRRSDRPTRFLLIGWSDTFIHAWKSAVTGPEPFEASLHLHLPGSGLTEPPSDVPGTVTASSHPMDQAAMTAMYLDHDVMLSAHRRVESPKFPIEFMATGGCVIADKGGEHENWLHREIAYVIDPTVTVADLLRQAAGDKTHTLRLGGNAAKFVRETYAWPQVVARMLKTLEAL